MPGTPEEQNVQEIFAAGKRGSDLVLQILLFTGILCAGYSEKMDQDKAELAGIKGFLLKPVLGFKMPKTVRRVLDSTIKPYKSNGAVGFTKIRFISTPFLIMDIAIPVMDGMEAPEKSVSLNRQKTNICRSWP